jgi:virginiamycin A acetyltransferase
MRERVKDVADLLATVSVLPALAYYYGLVGLGGNRNRVLESCSQALALIPGLPGQYARRAFYSRTIEYCGRGAVISFAAVLSSVSARIGDHAYIGPFCTIGAAHIGADTLVAAGAQIPSGRLTHGIDPGGSMRENAGTPTTVTIGAGVWIGNNAVVMADVGDGAVIGAGAVVTKPIPARTIAAGVPARVIRTRDAVAPTSL